MSTLKADAVTTKSDNTDLTLTGGGTGVPNLEAGFKVGGSAGVPTASVQDDAITLAKLAAGTDGELITWDASGDPAAVAVGTATHVLTSNGVGAAPTFQAAGGGAWGVKTSGTFSGVAAFAVTGITKYTEFYFFNFHRDSGSGDVQFRTSGDNGSSYDSGSTDYDYVRNQLSSSSSNPDVINSGAGQTSINTHGAPYPIADMSDAWIHVRLPNPTAQLWNILLWDMWHNDAEDSSPMFIRNGIGQRQGVYSPDADIDAIQVTLTDGSNMSGSYVVVELD